MKCSSSVLMIADKWYVNQLYCIQRCLHWTHIKFTWFKHQACMLVVTWPGISDSDCMQILTRPQLFVIVLSVGGGIHPTGTCGWIRDIRETFGFEKLEVFWTSVSWQVYWRLMCLWLPLTLNCYSFGALQPPHPLFPFIASHQLCRNSPDAAVMPLTADVSWHIPIKSGNVTNIEY